MGLLDEAGELGNNYMWRLCRGKITTDMDLRDQFDCYPRRPQKTDGVSRYDVGWCENKNLNFALDDA